jgi:hypothetical protein
VRSVDHLARSLFILVEVDNHGRRDVRAMYKLVQRRNDPMLGLQQESGQEALVAKIVVHDGGRRSVESNLKNNFIRARFS